jgi:hypothetical protein
MAMLVEAATAVPWVLLVDCWAATDPRKTTSRATVIHLEDRPKEAHIPDRLLLRRITLQLLIILPPPHTVSLQAHTAAQADRPLVHTVLPTIALLDNNMGNISRRTTTDHHQASMAVSLHMLLQVTNMINIASTSTINTAVHQTTANLNTTRSILPTNLVKVAATGSNPAANQATVGYRQDRLMVDLMADLNTGNSLMVGQLKNSLRSISTISMVERMSS